VNAYTLLLRPFLFRLDAEKAHRLVLRQLSVFPPALLRLIFGRPERCLPQPVFGLEFPTRVGLAAGMDKNAVALRGWEALGFGFVEIGTITACAQPGNPRPRLFRYPEQGALVNRMGFNNEGADAVAARLERLRKRGKWPTIPVGVNLGKSKVTALDALLLVKIAPDMADQQAVDLAALAQEEGVVGLIATNTTLDHSRLPRHCDEEGGLSGAPLRQPATRFLKILRDQTSLALIGSGGVVDAASAKEKFDAGARLVQIYTGLVYRGPQLIQEIASLSTENSSSSSP
jgi:dihydroorotate dehydrogenase